MFLRRFCVISGRKAAFVIPHRMSHLLGHPECQPRPPNPYFDPGFEYSIWGPRPRTVIAGKNQVTMAKGIGIWPELMDIVRRVFLCANAPIDFEVIDFDEDAEYDDFTNLIYSVERNGVAIKGHFGVDLKPEEELMTSSFRMKRALDLCINLVEVKSYPALVEKTRLKNYVDVVIVCPNAEGANALLEHDNGSGVTNLRVTTEYNTRRVAEFAFEYAVKHKRRKVTLVYNKGIMNRAEGTIVDAVSDVATRFPEMQFHKQSMKAFIFKLRHFAFNGDVIVAMPLYGGLIKNILFGIMQGTGLYCAQNLGPRYAVFEAAARNKGLKMIGKDVANPVAALDAGVKLLHYLGHHESAERIQQAIMESLNTDRVHTPDMMGDAGTSVMVANIERRIRENMPEGYTRTHTSKHD